MKSNIKSQEASLIPSSLGVSGLKMVKNASIFQEEGVYFIRHYETIIFAYDPTNNKVEANWKCSTTSDRQIRSALSFFNLSEEQTVNTHNGSKWNYSGPLI